MVDPSIQLIISPPMDQDPSEQTPIRAKLLAHQALETSDDTSRTADNESSYAWTNVPIQTGVLNTGITQ